MRATLLIASAAACLGCMVLASGSVSHQQPPKRVSFAILEDYDKGQDLDDVDKDFALFNDLEIRTWRGSFGWDDYEPERGRFDLRWLRQFVERAASRGIQLRPYLGYTPEWAARRGGADADAWNNPPRDVARWARFASTVARTLRRYPNVLSYEIYNEQNVRQWWDGGPEDYARVLVRGSRAVRGVDRDARILFGGMVFPDLEWVETVCGQPGVRGAFDVMPFHAYPETWTPPDVTVENYLGGLDQFIALADRACGRAPIWINEMGFATVPGKTEREQAGWWVRAVATFLAHPRVEHIGVYEIKDLPTDKPVIGDAPNYHLGLTRVDRTKKLAFYTVDLLTDLLDTGTLRIVDQDVSISGDGESTGTFFHHLFERPDGDRVLFVWHTHGAPNVTIALQGDGRAVVEYGLDGKPAAVETFDGRAIRGVTFEPGAPRIFRISR